MFRKMPIILLSIIIAIVCLDTFIPLPAKQFLYALSLSLKSIIVFALPLIIFCLLFKTIVTLSNSATKIIGLIIGLVCVSNFLSTFLSHYVGMWVYGFDVSMIKPSAIVKLQPLWSIKLPKLIDNDYAMFASIIMGLLASKYYTSKAFVLAHYFDKAVRLMLSTFVYIIPVFVAGFVVKMQFDGVIHMIIKDYTSIFLVIAAAQFSYIILWYFMLNYPSLQKPLHNIKNMLPATMSAFSTMSSAASIPLTIVAAENNGKDKDIARSVIPATVNIHLVGDCFAIPIFAYAVLKSFGVAEPSFMSYLIFSFYFVIAKFSVAAVPGGGIIVMIPVLEGYLGFNAEMISLITALYILFDPVITSANVLGNGAFAKMIDNVVAYMRRAKKEKDVSHQTL